MGRVTVEIHGKPYVIGCEDGREAHLEVLTARIDEKARQVAPEAGSAGEARLLLMAALMITDELAAAEAAINASEARAEAMKLAFERLQSRVVDVLDAAADRLDQMALDSSPGQPLLL